MTREELEHIIRAAETIADVEDLIVIGSQAVLGKFPNATPELLISNQAGIFPRSRPERSDLIDSTIGEGSPFQNTFGDYAHGVGESTAFLPEGWRDRLKLVPGENTRFIRAWCLERGWCLEVHDLAIAKYVAGRPKDLEFTEALVRHGMVTREVLRARLGSTPLDPAVRELAEKRIERQFFS